MALPKSFSAIQLDPQGREFVTHKPSGVRYYINRKIDPKLRGTTGLSSTPYDASRSAGDAPRSVASVISAGEPLPVRKAPMCAGAPVQHVPAARAPIRARFIKGSAPKDNHEYF